VLLHFYDPAYSFFGRHSRASNWASAIIESLTRLGGAVSLNSLPLSLNPAHPPGGFYSRRRIKTTRDPRLWAPPGRRFRAKAPAGKA